MRIRLMIVLIMAVVASGCANKEEANTASPVATTTVQPSPGATPATGDAQTGGTTGGGGTPTATPSGGTPAKEEPLPTMTKEQVEQISMTSTYADMVKLTGSKGKLVKEENGKKTYEFAISNQPGYYVAIVYFDDGKISEKRVYQK
ncbi:hypothetical protein [Paenibacillus sedimenti]|uniref:PepSY domain-containing protein n=1 Tax=Paenibacillus sedimenti TaxID=2770274 RepID=A0A926KU82_9BACL|nr:hypothetical protein [Paenibacillus sedimenti]MBD0382244.1 hypothetical protein [Paenibacillus sedimenti]